MTREDRRIQLVNHRNNQALLHAGMMLLRHGIPARCGECIVLCNTCSFLNPLWKRSLKENHLECESCIEDSDTKIRCRMTRHLVRDGTYPLCSIEKITKVLLETI